MPADDTQEMMAKKLERLRKEHGPQVSVEAREARTIEQPEVEVEWTHDATLWPRFGAMVGLGFGREVLGEGWLDSDLAGYLRDVMFGREAKAPAPHAPLAPISETIEESDMAEFLTPPGHVVNIVGTDHGAVLTLFLFGDQRYVVPLGGTVTDQDEATWVFDAPAGKAQRMSWEQFAENAAMRLGGLEEGADLTVGD